MKKTFALNIIVLMAMLLLNAMTAVSQPSGWNYKKGFTVTENTGSDLYGYQIRLTVDTETPIAAGQMSPTGDDIRFGKYCNQPVFFDYWIESGINTTNTVIWVKIDTLPAGATLVVQMFYGNGSATPAATLGIFNGPQSATDSVSDGSPGGVGDSQRGFRFSSDEDILVTAFGKNEPTGTTRYITLFDFSTQAILKQIQVSGPAAQYDYGDLPEPLWLTAGTQYLIEMFQSATDGYYFGGTPQAGSHITYYDMRYCNGCTPSTFPTNSLSAMHYGFVDFWYYTRQNVTPAPSFAWQSAGFSVDAGDPVVLCAGTDTLIGDTAVNGNAPYSYLWSPGDGLSSTSLPTPVCAPLMTTSYAVSVTDRYGCAVIDTVSVTVNPSPTVSFVGLNPFYCIDAAEILLGGSPLGGTFSGAGITGNTFNPALAGAGIHDIIYVYADSNNCVNSDTISTIINDLPVVSLTGLTTLYCQNDAVVTLTGTPSGGTFSGNGVTGDLFDPSVADTGYFYIHYEYTDGNGCTNQDSLLIQVPQLPVATLSGLAADYCLSDGQVTLNSSPAGGVFSGDGVSGNTFTPATAGLGTHQVVYSFTDENGCTVTDSADVLVNGCAGISNYENPQVQILPNPNNGRFTIINAAEIKGTNYEIINALGERVFSKEASSAREEINALNLPNGLYLLKIIRGSQSWSHKMVISK